MSTLVDYKATKAADRPSTLLNIRDLRTYFFTEKGVVKAVDGVSFDVPVAKTVGIVGESGCGKSVTGLSIMRLVAPPGRIVQGSVTFRDREGVADLVSLPEAEIRKIRGSKIAMIFQEPMTSLNPVFTIGSQILEAIQLHRPDLGRRKAGELVVELLNQVGVPDPEKRQRWYPHQLSGGMRQRVMIAMALSCEPRLLIADEPTTALDVTIQAQILELLRELQAKKDMSVIMITHDLGIVAEMADEVLVMYASRIVEKTSVTRLFANPLHPYTWGLFRARPVLGMTKGKELVTIPGDVPNAANLPRGCKFCLRCKFVQDRCREEEPELTMPEPGHEVRCHFAGELAYER
ncbi:MAG: ABC transporter ATP-binding protein [Thermogutta sp.]